MCKDSGFQGLGKLGVTLGFLKMGLHSMLEVVGMLDYEGKEDIAFIL